MYNSIKYLYPSAEAQVDFELRDDGQGAGVYIHRWDTAKLGVQPTPAQLLAVKAAADLVPAKATANEIIRERLAAADLKIIRAITEGDTAKIAAHLTAQAKLRAQLIPE